MYSIREREMAKRFVNNFALIIVVMERNISLDRVAPISINSSVKSCDMTFNLHKIKTLLQG